MKSAQMQHEDKTEERIIKTIGEYAELTREN